MSDVIKSISLDDVVGLQGQGKDLTQSSTVVYNPQYGGAYNPFQTTNTDLITNQQPLRSVSMEGSSGTVLSRLTAIIGRFDKSANMSKYIKLGALILALLVAFAVADGDGMLSEFFSQFGSSEQPEIPADDLVLQNANPQPELAKPEPPPSTPADLQNPYWSLPNPLEAVPGPAGGSLNAGQEARWRQGLAHPFIWQRYKTVIDVRAARLSGSHHLLNDALAQPKFWTRMEALIALAESGEAVDIDTVEAGIGSTRRSLQQNYFRRFRQKATDGEVYIMRQAIRVVDAGTRRVILENLSNRRDETNELYLVAATYDPNVKVNGWINQILADRPLSQEALVRFQQIAAGLEPPTEAVPAPATPVPASKVQDLNVEELPRDPVNVEEVYFLKDEAKVERKTVPVDDGFQDLEQKPE